MNAITVPQPYASRVANGEKWIDNRKWTTSERGWIAIHAGWAAPSRSPARRLAANTTFPSGCVIAVAHLIAVVSLYDVRERRHLHEPIVDQDSSRPITWAEVATNKHFVGPYCLIFDEIRRFDEPRVVTTGALGIWRWPFESLAALQRGEHIAGLTPVPLHRPHLLQPT